MPLFFGDAITTAEDGLTGRKGKRKEASADKHDTRQAEERPAKMAIMEVHNYCVRYQNNLTFD